MDLKWIKISLDIFYDEKMKLIEAMPENDTINYIWIRLLIQAGRTNAGGLIFLSEGKPYTEEMLATIFNRPINSIRLGVGTLRNLGMIDIDKNNIIRIVNWEKYQNVEGMERVREQTRKRVAKCRAKKKNDVMESNVTVTKEKEEEDNRYINISIKKENE
ncbi:MAG: phage replisome organizer N-terminal domain-containing protein, partial [Clostridium sp.]